MLPAASTPGGSTARSALGARWISRSPASMSIMASGSTTPPVAWSDRCRQCPDTPTTWFCNCPSRVITPSVASSTAVPATAPCSWPFTFPHARPAAAAEAAPRPADHQDLAGDQRLGLAGLRLGRRRHATGSSQRRPPLQRRRLLRGYESPRQWNGGCWPDGRGGGALVLSLIHISEPTRLGMISYAVFCLTKT